MIPRQPFGATGHDSSRVVFGAAALLESTETESQRVLERPSARSGACRHQVAEHDHDAEGQQARDH